MILFKSVVEENHVIFSGGVVSTNILTVTYQVLILDNVSFSKNFKLYVPSHKKV